MVHRCPCGWIDSAIDRLASGPPARSFVEVRTQGLSRLEWVRAVVEPKPDSIHARSGRAKPLSEIRVKIVCRDLVRWDVLPPMCRHAVQGTSRDLDDEATSVSIKLHGQKVDARGPSPAKVWQCAGESKFSQLWYKDRLQSVLYVVGVHGVGRTYYQPAKDKIFPQRGWVVHCH